MSDLLLAPTARAVMELMGEMPVDPLHEFAFDVEALMRRIERIQWKDFFAVENLVQKSKGLFFSTQVVQDGGYQGTYLN